MKIRPDQLEQAIRAELESYSQEVGQEVDLAVINVAKKALRRIKQTAPKRTGDYRKGWTMKQSRERSRTTVTLYNKTRYMLTHLLEHGFQKGAGGRVEGQPHIGPATEQSEEDLISEVTRRLGG